MPFPKYKSDQDVTSVPAPLVVFIETGLLIGIGLITLGLLVGVIGWAMNTFPCEVYPSSPVPTLVEGILYKVKCS